MDEIDALRTLGRDVPPPEPATKRAARAALLAHAEAACQPPAVAGRRRSGPQASSRPRRSRRPGPRRRRGQRPTPDRAEARSSGGRCPQPRRRHRRRPAGCVAGRLSTHDVRGSVSQRRRWRARPPERRLGARAGHPRDLDQVRRFWANRRVAGRTDLVRSSRPGGVAGAGLTRSARRHPSPTRASVRRRRASTHGSRSPGPAASTTRTSMPSQPTSGHFAT